MPRRFAFSDLSQTCNGFAPFEALQPTQHKAMFSRVAMLIYVPMSALCFCLNWIGIHSTHNLYRASLPRFQHLQVFPSDYSKLNPSQFYLGCTYYKPRLILWQLYFDLLRIGLELGVPFKTTPPSLIVFESRMAYLPFLLDFCRYPFTIPFNSEIPIG